jgi:hypothetical protein
VIRKTLVFAHALSPNFLVNTAHNCVNNGFILFNFRQELKEKNCARNGSDIKLKSQNPRI